MSCFFKFSKETSVSIPQFIETNSIVFYELHIKVNEVEWYIQRRYNEFYEFNDKVVDDHGVSKALLPPKKLVGNKNPAFVEQRRFQLEEYIKKLLNLFRVHMPRCFVEFLHFNKYDIIYLLQDLSKSIVECNGSGLRTKEYEFSVLELFAISERICLPCPAIDERDKYDFSHVLDFCSQLEYIKITPIKTHDIIGGDYNAVDVPIGRSNLIPKKLFFNLNAFRNLIKLNVLGISTENIVDIAIHRPNLKEMCVHNSVITRVNQSLVCDNIHKNIASSDTCEIWEQLDTLDFTSNLLTTIDESIKLAPNLRVLKLNQNRLTNIQNLSSLSHLEYLSLSVNLISNFKDWNLELGNLVSLNLSQNKIQHLDGLKRLYSLVNLDLSCNMIEDLKEVKKISLLPLLENLRLTGNPLAGSVDYRPRVLAGFHNRSSDIYLDNEKATPQELDMALVLSALEQSQII